MISNRNENKNKNNLKIITENFKKGSLFEDQEASSETVYAAPIKAPARELDRIDIENLNAYIGELRQSEYHNQVSVGLNNVLKQYAKEFNAQQGDIESDAKKEAKFAFSQGVNRQFITGGRLINQRIWPNIIRDTKQFRNKMQQGDLKSRLQAYNNFKQKVKSITKTSAKYALADITHSGFRRFFKAVKTAYYLDIDNPSAIHRGKGGKQATDFVKQLRTLIERDIEKVMIQVLELKEKELKQEKPQDRISGSQPDLRPGIPRAQHWLDNAFASLDDESLGIDADDALRILNNAGNDPQAFKTLLTRLAKEMPGIFGEKEIGLLIILARQRAAAGPPGSEGENESSVPSVVHGFPPGSKFGDIARAIVRSARGSSDTAEKPSATPDAAATDTATPDAGAATATAAATGTTAAATTTGTTSKARPQSASASAGGGTAGTGGGSIDRRRTRIARQAIGNNAVRKLQLALAKAGFPPVEGMKVQQEVKEVKKHNIKSISNNWSSWLLSEQVGEIKPEDYKKYGIDGKYGKSTIAAVEAFQKAVKSGNPKANLGKSGPKKDGVDGTVGKLTWALLQKAAKGQLKVDPPVVPQKTGAKGEDLKQTRKTTKAADDAREKLRKGRFKFLEEVHKWVLAAAEVKGSAYVDLVKFTKSTKASMGKEGITLWNDFRFWEAWINENTTAIKKLVLSRKENKSKKFPLRSFPKGGERMKLKALLKKHRAEIDAWNKAFEASLKQKYPDETPEQAKKKKADKAAQLENLNHVFNSMAGLSGLTQAELIKAENRFQEMLEKGKLAAMASGARVANKHKINIGNPSKTGSRIASQGSLTEDASTLYGALEPNGTDEDAVESTIKKYLGAMSGNLKDFNRTHFINPSYGYFKAHTLLFYYNGFEEANGTSMDLLERLKDDGEDAIAKKLERRLDYEKRFAIILLGLIDPNNKKSLINQYRLAGEGSKDSAENQDKAMQDYEKFQGLFSISEMAKPPFKLKRVRKTKSKAAQQVTKSSPAPGRSRR